MSPSAALPDFEVQVTGNQRFHLPASKAHPFVPERFTKKMAFPFERLSNPGGRLWHIFGGHARQVLDFVRSSDL